MGRSSIAQELEILVGMLETELGLHLVGDDEVAISPESCFLGI